MDPAHNTEGAGLEQRLFQHKTARLTITIILLINATNVRNKSRATQKWINTKYKIKKIQ